MTRQRPRHGLEIPWCCSQKFSSKAKNVHSTHVETWQVKISVWVLLGVIYSVKSSCWSVELTRISPCYVRLKEADTRSTTLNNQRVLLHFNCPNMSPSDPDDWYRTAVTCDDIEKPASDTSYENAIWPPNGRRLLISWLRDELTTTVCSVLCRWIFLHILQGLSQRVMSVTLVIRDSSSDDHFFDFRWTWVCRIKNH